MGEWGGVGQQRQQRERRGQLGSQPAARQWWVSRVLSIWPEPQRGVRTHKYEVVRQRE